MFRTHHKTHFTPNRRFDMKEVSLFTLSAAVLLGAGSVSAATITAAQISDAATSPDTSDLGDTSITIGDFTIASTGDSSNLGWSNIESIGVVGNGKDDSVMDNGTTASEELTLSFDATVTVNSIILTGHGRNDLTAVIGGFSSDPGAVFGATLPTGWTVTYDAINDEVEIATNDNSGFFTQYTLTFANDVDVTALTITTFTSNAGAGGVGFGGITYVPEPGSLALLGMGGLLMLKRRRRD